MEPDDLYGLPLDQFIPERTALARSLRADARRDEAAEVAALRKPSVAAWAVNQLVRTQTGRLGELADAGDGLLEAQAQLLSGQGDGSTLRVAAERERDAVDGLLDAARGLLSSEGHELSQSILARVADTLHAAALDPAAREQIVAGRLERELQHVGMGDAALGFGAVSAKPTEPPAAKVRRAAERERTEARRQARMAEGKARRRADLTRKEVQTAEQRRDAAARALDQAQTALEAARADADAAEEAHQRARQELDRHS